MRIFFSLPFFLVAQSGSRPTTRKFPAKDAGLKQTIGRFLAKQSKNMTAKRFLAFFVLLASIGLSVFVLLRNNQYTPAELLDAEREIYSRLLLDQRNDYSIEIDKFQIVEYTNSGEFQGSIPTDSVGYNAGFDIKEFPELKRKTWLDFQEKNKTPTPIRDFLPVTADVILVNPSGVGINSGTKNEQLYWWVSFSRIGFNSSLTQALVLVGDCRGESCYKSTNDSM